MIVISLLTCNETIDDSATFVDYSPVMVNPFTLEILDIVCG